MPGSKTADQSWYTPTKCINKKDSDTPIVMKFMVVPIGHNVFWLAKFGLELLVSDLFMTVPISQNISGLPNLDLALRLAIYGNFDRIWAWKRAVTCTEVNSVIQTQMRPLKENSPHCFDGRSAVSITPPHGGYIDASRLWAVPKLRSIFVHKPPPCGIANHPMIDVS